MKFPNINETYTSKDMTTYFSGLNRTPSCVEGEFEELKNVTTNNFPVLCPRDKRGFVRQFTSIQGILDKESLIWIDSNKLYIDGVEQNIGVSISDGKKKLYKVGAFIVIMPDKIWYNCDKKEGGSIVSTATVSSGTSISFTLCNGDGTAITWHDENYYKSHAPSNGDYMMTTTDTKSSLKVYSSATSMWAAVTTTYMKIESTGIGTHFKKDDGIKITIDNSAAGWSYAKKIFVNEEEDGKLSLNSYVYDKGDNYITIIALLDVNKTFTNLPTVIERPMKDMPYMTECQNRLWGCSADGHEIYCCKLGDVTNWNYYAGISSDSYGATVGSDGLFTGCVTYNNNPIFFKENSFLKVNVSGTGAHSYREQIDRGVQSGSSDSLCIVEGVLYYKGISGIYAYDGSSPALISEKIENHRYTSAKSGTIDGRYYIAMKCDGSDEILVYDTKKGLWSREDNLSVDAFCENKGNLLILSGNKLYSVNKDSYQAAEKDIDWMAQSGCIGFAISDKKYVARVNIRMFLELGAYCDFYIQYDSQGAWHHVFNMQGHGTRSFVIPVTPRRCDHFKYRVSGKGGCKIFSITKTVEEGSDI